MNRKLFFVMYCSMNIYCEESQNYRATSAYSDRNLMVNYIGIPQFKAQDGTLSKPYKITKPGIHLLAESIVSVVPSNSTIITISSSNVILDLNHFSLIYGGGGSNIISILIDTGCTNVMIRNGYIITPNGYSIVGSKGISSIMIDEIFITGGLGGIAISSANDVVIKNSRIGECLNSKGETVGLDMDNSQNIKISKVSSIGHTGAPSQDAYGIRLQNCLNCIVTNSVSANHTGKNAYGYAFFGVSFATFESNISSGNSGMVENAYGIYFSNSTSVNVTRTFSQQHTAQMNAYGFNCLSGCQSIAIENSVMSDQRASNGDAIGIALHQGNGCFVRYSNCFGNTVVGVNNKSKAVGIYLNGTTNDIIENCLTSSNNGNKGNGYGILVDASNQCLFRKNKSYFNGGAGGYGICDNLSTSLFIANECFSNQNDYAVMYSKSISIVPTQYTLTTAVKGNDTSYSNVSILPKF